MIFEILQNFFALQIGHSAGATSASVVQPHTAHTNFFIIHYLRNFVFILIFIVSVFRLMYKLYPRCFSLKHIFKKIFENF